MTLLGIFSRRPKTPAAGSSKDSSTPERDSAPSRTSHTTLDADYVFPGTDIPLDGYLSTALPAASSSKLKLPFGRRKRSTPSSPPASPPASPTHPPWTRARTPIDLTTLGSDSGSNNPRKPPTHANIFAMHENPSTSKSTQSLPTLKARSERPGPTPTQRPVSDDEGGGDTPLSSKKSMRNMFGWTHRQRRQSKVSAEPPVDPLPPIETFNLKSFRHVRPDSPTAAFIAGPTRAESPVSERTATPPVPTYPLSPPVLGNRTARPRGNSSTSVDTAQRISVAAFREAQARRSTTNLALPSTSSPEAVHLDSRATRKNTHSHTLAPLGPKHTPAPTLSERPSRRRLQARRSTAPPSVVVDGLDSSSSDSSDRGSTESDPSSSVLDRAQKKPNPGRARSELGHSRGPSGSSMMTVQSEYLPRRPHTAVSVSQAPSSFGWSAGQLYSRPQSSLSTSALTETVPSQRTSTALSEAAVSAPMRIRSPGSDTDESSEDPASDDDEDAPLSTLAMKRPPSTAPSTTPSRKARKPSKPLLDFTKMPARASISQAMPEARARTLSSNMPLIDVNTLKVNPPQVPSAGNARTLSPTDITERLSKLTQGLGNTSHSPDKSNQQLSASPQDVTGGVRNESGGAGIHVPFIFPRRRTPSKGTSSVSIMNSAPTTQQTERPSSTLSVPEAVATPTPQPTHRPPIPIRHRPTASSFSVVSRPSTTYAAQSSSPPLAPQSSSPVPNTRTKSAPSPPDGVHAPRPAPTPLVPTIPFSEQPTKPFASLTGGRRNSPGSSTGGSSNGQTPLTPYDGSDYGSGIGVRDGSSIASGSGVRASGRSSSSDSPTSSAVGTSSKYPNVKRGSVDFGDFNSHGPTPRNRKRDEKIRSGAGAGDADVETRRRERRRGEAKAAIELGKVINGPGPVVDDEEDEDEDDTPLINNMGPRINSMSPMMGPNLTNFNFTQQPPPTGWGHSAPPTPMLNPAQFMIPPVVDPNFLVAHQHAMMIAAQAYQLAVAQQSMATANEEWERSSSASAFAGAGGMSGGGFGMGFQPGWHTGPYLYPPAPRSMYAGSDAGGYPDMGGGLGWGSGSAYGEPFGPALGDHPSKSSLQVHGNNYAGQESMQNAVGGQRPRPRSKSFGANVTFPPQQPGVARRPVPPSSWKTSA